MMKSKTCNWVKCGNVFEPQANSQRYCCDACRAAMNEFCKTRGGSLVRLAIEQSERDAVAHFKQRRRDLLKELDLIPIGG